MRYVLSFLGGLIATPVVTFFLGWVLFGRRDSWNIGQGESFLSFVVAVYAAPAGAVYWTIVAVVHKALRGRVSGGWIFLTSLIVFVTALNVVLWAVDRGVF